MINCLYDEYKEWSSTGSILYILSDLHLDDEDCKLMDPEWISPEEQMKILMDRLKKTDTFICLGDVGNAEYLRALECRKILILGNHDKKSKMTGIFDRIYNGPLFIAPKLILSH